MNPFRASLNDIFKSPSSSKQLAAATKANDAWIVWEKSQDMKDWKAFLRLYCKITDVNEVEV